MIKKIINNILYFMMLFVLGGYSCAGLTVYVPKTDYNSVDLEVGQSVIQVQKGSAAGESFIQKFIQNINDYGMFFVAFILLILFVYAGFKIITAQGDKEKIKKGYHLLVAGFVVIFISLLSYSIVQLLVNLF